MSGSLLTAFADFTESVTPAYTQMGPKHLFNAAGKNTYLWPTMFDEKRSIGGGEDIRSSVQFKDNGTYEHVLPGNWNNWQNPQLLDKVTTPWCFGIAHWSYNAKELLLNDKMKYGNDDAIWEAFTNLRDQKLTGCFTNIANGLEESLFAAPDATNMEGAASSTTPAPMSIFAYINQNTNGLWSDGSAAWTTVSGIDPTSASVNGQYTPQQETYSSVTADDETNVVAGLDSLYMACDFQQPRTMAEYFNDPMLSKLKILTSKRGRKVFMALTRGGTDRYASAGMAGYQDPSMSDPQMHGIPVSYCSELDTAAVYLDTAGTAVVTEANAANTGPRFYMWNGNYCFPVVHPARYLKQDTPLRHPNVPDTYVVPTYVWWNLHCPSRKHQGILSPSTDV